MHVPTVVKISRRNALAALSLPLALWSAIGTAQGATLEEILCGVCPDISGRHEDTAYLRLDFF